MNNFSSKTKEILTPEASQFLIDLHNEFNDRREDLLQQRKDRQRSIDAGDNPVFLNGTQNIRQDNMWTVAPVLEDLQDRRVEITGPTNRKMVINALNCGAQCFMADFEDSNSPTWENMIEGQLNLRDAVNRNIDFTHASGKHYSLNENIATLLVRARGWHLEEKHFKINGKPISGSLFDFGLYFFHNARPLIEKGSGPYFYLPKLQNHLEARLWNDVFQMAQDKLNIPQGTIKATVLIEHILAAFETEEILYELREHSSGLNCGRWDYIFSLIKTFRNRKDFILPDRAQITMTAPCMAAYCKEVVRACHKRNAHAMGGMAAQIPIKNNPDANADALNKVRLDKEREASLGFFGTWVAHPGLVSIALEAFSDMKTPDQLEHPSAEELLAVPEGTVTEEGLRINCNVGIAYLEAWLRGNGCVPLYNLMEDLATSEISRTQVWQWIKHKKSTEKGQEINSRYFRTIMHEELGNIERNLGKEQYKAGKFSTAATLFNDLCTNDNLENFLSIPAYKLL